MFKTINTNGRWEAKPALDQSAKIDLRVFAGFRRVVGLLFLCTGLSVSAQEALRNMQAGDSAADERKQEVAGQQHQDYTYKNGDFRLLVLPSLGMDWNDNVNLSKTNKWDDWIVRPSLGITMSYPLSQKNLLYLNIGVGYNRYLNHPSLSTFDLNSSSGTGLAFDVGVKDVTINFHDWISYVQNNLSQTVYGQNGAQNGTIANSGTYGTFQNTAGLAATWDLNQVTLSAGYDHQNVLATSSQYDNINHSAELLFVRSGFQVHPQVTVGLESTAAFTRYDQSGSSNNALNNNDAYTVGPYTTFQYSEFLSLTARGGYSTYQFQQTSSSIQTSSQNTWYAGLTLSHQPRESISYAISAGRESSLGTSSDLTEDWYVRPNITWNIIKDWSFNTSMFYQHGRQGVGNISGNLKDTYDWYGGGLSLSHALTSRLTVALNYRLTIRSSSIPGDEYTQNLIGLRLTYHPQ